MGGRKKLVALEAAWYAGIELGVREFVRHLRNRGINTVCSCEHEMLVQVVCDAEELKLLWEACTEFYGDEHACEIAFYWHGWHRFAEVRLRLPDGDPNPKWRGGQDWAGNPYCVAGGCPNG